MKLAHIAAAPLCASLVAAMLTGCASFCPVGTTPESIAARLRTGDTVRIETRAKRKLRLLVSSVEDRQIKGRRNGDPAHPVWVAFGAIDTLEVECGAPR